MTALYLVCGSASADALNTQKIHVVRFTQEWTEAVALREDVDAQESEASNTRESYRAYRQGYRLVRSTKYPRQPGERKWCGLGIGYFEAAYLVRLKRNAPLWVQHRIFYHDTYTRVGSYIHTT